MPYRAVVSAALVVGFGAAGVSAAPVAVVSYTYDAVNGEIPSGSYPDGTYSQATPTGTPTELDDGLRPATASYTDANWVGINDHPTVDDGRPQPLLTFDLGADYVLDQVTIEYLSDVGNIVFPPDRVDITFAPDGGTFTTAPLTYSTFTQTTTPTIQQSTVDLGGATARYVRMAFYNDREWTFLSEFDFEGTPVPEPSGLLAVGAGAMMTLLRRRRSC